jgi:outer membrane protein assembly factor BamB
MEKRKMIEKTNTQKSSNKIAALAIVLMITMAVSMTMTPAFAQKYPTAGHIWVNPPVVGLGQTANIIAFVTPAPPLRQGSIIELYQNYTLRITKPDSKVIDIVNITAYGDGSAYYLYIPDQVGTYRAVFSWAGTSLIEGATASITFEVQSEPLPSYPDTPLPTDYWEHPIDAQNRMWYSISGGWLQSSFAGGPNGATDNFNRYSTSPSTSHVLWENPISFGGLVGGDYGSLGTSASASPVIMWGMCFYTANNRINAIDLRTGRMLWNITGSGSLFAVPNPGPYLFAVGNSINRYNPYTGELQTSVARPAQYTGGQAFADIGVGKAYLYFRINDTTPIGLVTKYDMLGTSTNFTQNILWNDVITASNQTGSFITVDNSNGLILPMGNMYREEKYIMAINATDGRLVWSVLPGAPLEVGHTIGDGKIYTMTSFGQVRAYDLKDGHLVWTSEKQDEPWGGFNAYSMAFANGIVYNLCYDGHVYARNSTTGALVWKFGDGQNPSDPRSTTSTGETPYGVYPFYGGFSIADGKIFVSNNEHTPTQPLWRGARIYALDALTGRKLWSLNNFFGSSQKPVAEGVVTASNDYTSELYGFGKGLSSIAISASRDVVPAGQSLLISGKITDLSPAQIGTALASDESMDAWMNYLHQGEVKPANFTGVPVELSAVRSDGSITNIGTVQNDDTGLFSALWTPQSEGTYTIVAKFVGTNSYFASSTETAVGVSEAPVAEPQAVDNMPMYLAISTILIVAAIAIAAVLLLRKRP